ncbi:MAG: hypothetical protein GXY14_16345 [Spirochaetes bacterium]|nr:hypothetical protein [Spirochaetota bacterium]
MKKILSILIVIVTGAILSCSSSDELEVQSLPSLISEEFVSDNTYEVVCRGFPKQGLDGFQKNESAKRAALLNAYYFVRARFDDSIQPDRDGTVVKYDVMDEFAIVQYRIKKSNLKRYVKKN